MMMMMMIIDHIYIYILKAHRHGISKIRNASAIPARSNVRVAPNMFNNVELMMFNIEYNESIIYIFTLRGLKWVVFNLLLAIDLSPFHDIS